MKMPLHFRQLAQWALLITFLVSCAGCGASFTSERIDPTQNIPKMAGIPYCMSRPVYLLEIKPIDGSSYEYEIKVDYVPDFENVYTVNINPDTLSENDFNLTINEYGILMSTNMARRQQIGPAILSLGKFVGGVIGATTGLDWFGMGKAVAPAPDDLQEGTKASATPRPLTEKGATSKTFTDCWECENCTNSLECEKCKKCKQGKSCYGCSVCTDCRKIRGGPHWLDSLAAFLRWMAPVVLMPPLRLVLP